MSASDPVRRPELLVTGTVFLDLVFTGLRSEPTGGREVMADGMGSSPGGAANLAIAAARLGVDVGLAVPVAEDVYGDYCWDSLEDEGVDLTWSRRVPGWHSPVTVSLAYADDRAMVTHAHDAPGTSEALLGALPASEFAFADLGSGRPPWVDHQVERGSRVVADVGWDGTGSWDGAELRRRLEGCHAFVPNAVEAMSYTGTDHPGAALQVLRDWVPLAVVTSGSGGAYAADETTGETAWVPGLHVSAVDPTGAGDVFLAALVFGSLRAWPLEQRLRFANLAAALSVRDVGGALAAPGWADVCDWWTSQDPASRVAHDHAFLEEVLGGVEHRVCRRAVPTIGFVQEEHDHSRHGPRPAGRPSRLHHGAPAGTSSTPPQQEEIR